MRLRVRQLWRTLSTLGLFGAAMVILLSAMPAASGSTRQTQSQGLPSWERNQLNSIHAFTTHPIRFALFGDSLAVTASQGLQYKSKVRYGVRVFDEGILGCDLYRGSSRLGGQVSTGSPNVNCGSWRSAFRYDLTAIHPDVAGLLIGRFELSDHLYQGQWMHVGQPAWDGELQKLLNQAVEELYSQGAKVALFTFPYIDPPQVQPDGTPYPENLPSRVDAWNRLIRAVALAHPKKVTLIRLNKLLDPDGHYTNYVDGVEVRNPSDGIHVTFAGGQWLQPRVLPTVGALGLKVRAAKGP